jgi:hypothetical protein
MKPFMNEKGACQSSGFADIEMMDGVPEPEDLGDDIHEAVDDYCNDAQEFCDMTFDVVNRKVIFFTIDIGKSLV